MNLKNKSVKPPLTVWDCISKNVKDELKDQCLSEDIAFSEPSVSSASFIEESYETGFPLLGQKFCKYKNEKKSEKSVKAFPNDKTKANSTHSENCPCQECKWYMELDKFISSQEAKLRGGGRTSKTQVALQLYRN